SSVSLSKPAIKRSSSTTKMLAIYAPTSTFHKYYHATARKVYFRLNSGYAFNIRNIRKTGQSAIPGSQTYIACNSLSRSIPPEGYLQAKNIRREGVTKI